MMQGREEELLIAGREGNTDLFKKLIIEEKVNPNFYDNNGETLLYHVIQKNQVDIIDILLEIPHIDVNLQPIGFRESPLQLAITCTDYQTFKKLLEHPNIDLNLRDLGGKTALHYAALHAYNDRFLNDLLKTTADIFIRDNGGKTILYYAVERTLSVKSIITLIDRAPSLLTMKNNRGNLPLHKAALINNYSIIDLLSQNVNVNSKNDEGQTPLHLASMAGSLTSMDVLLQNKSTDINAIDNNGNTPTHLALKYDHECAFQLLYKRIVDMNVVNDKGNSLLHAAVKNVNNVPSISILLRENEFLKNVKNNEGHTALDISSCQKLQFILIDAAHRNADTVLNWLLSKENINVNFGRRENGNTPLHYAVKYHNVEMVNALLSAGSNVMLKNHKGQTPLTFVAKQLLVHGQLLEIHIIMQNIEKCIPNGEYEKIVNEKDNEGNSYHDILRLTEPPSNRKKRLRGHNRSKELSKKPRSK